MFYFSSFSKAKTSTEAYNYEVKLTSTCAFIRQPNEVAKIVLEKEAKGLQNGAGVEMNLNDHNILEEIKFCAQDGKFSGPYQFAAASIGKFKFVLLILFSNRM